jgi:hypothetical protein
MSGKGAIRIVLLGFVAVSIGWFVAREATNTQDSGEIVQAQAPERQVMVYYFHRTARCATCLKIEELSKTSVEANFVPELQNGDLAFMTVNVEEQGNEHFVNDYDLVSQAVVLVDYREGVQEKWKSLDRTWDLVHTEDEFTVYVRDEVRAFLETL